MERSVSPHVIVTQRVAIFLSVSSAKNAGRYIKGNNMDWNGIVKVFGAYHGIECDEVETMEEADAQLCELYAKERPAITGKLITGAEWAEYQRLKAQKPTAPASNNLESWEDEAKAFYETTGYLRPGKDPGILGDTGYRERRDREWKTWCAGYGYCASLHPSTDKSADRCAELVKRLRGKVVEQYPGGVIGARGEEINAVLDEFEKEGK